MVAIEKNLQRVRQRIKELAGLYGRNVSDIQLIAVSKTQPASAIQAAYAAGARFFGESYLQEALAKREELAGLGIEWHFIGRIQGNKTRAIAEHFDWVHGLDSLAHAQRLSSQRPVGLGPLAVCLQVNLSGESSKGGVTPEALPELAMAVADLPGLRLRGLMTVPAPATGLAMQRQPFRQLAQLRQGLIDRGVSLDSLSMGMTDDLEAAIAEGATLVRVGTAIFGARDYGIGH